MSTLSLAQTLRDIRYGLRGLRRDWAFTVTSSASLALGIAAATAMFSVIYAVVIDPFPYKDVDSLTSIRVYAPEERYGRTYYTVDQYLEFRDRTSIFDGVIASTISDVIWTGGGDPQRIRGNHGPFDTFDVMGVAPLIGHAPSAADAAPDAPPVAVLGYRFWMRQFGGDPGVLGRYLTLNGVARRVIGIMPKRFMWRGADVYLPTHFRRGETVEGARFVHVLGRLKPGITAQRAETDLRPVVADLKLADPKSFPDRWRVGLLSFKETFPSDIRQALWILFAATGLLLLISCANVSNLMLSRAGLRQREMAVRASLGASRWRLVRQLLTESLVLAAGAGALGVLLAYVLLRAMISIVPPNTIPDEAEIVMNVPVLLFSAGISVVTALLFGLAPALHGHTGNLAEPLRSGARTAGISRGWRWLRSALVVGEVALSLVLLTGAFQMMRTLIRLQSVDLGFPPDRILAMRVPLSEDRYPTPENRVAFHRALIERAISLPGVKAASVSTGVHPLFGWRLPMDLPGGLRSDQPVGFHQVDPGYFAVYNFTLHSGRFFTATDTASKRQLAVVSEAFANKYFAGSGPLGRVIRVPRLSDEPFHLTDNTFEIVGVVRNAVNLEPKEGARVEVFVPYTVLGRAEALLVRAENDPHLLARSVASQVYAIDKEQPVMEIQTVEEMITMRGLSRPRFSFILFGVFASLGLVLAGIGVFGVISKSVAQRTPEFGIRMAIGASATDIAGMVLRGGLSMVLLGLVIGLGGAYSAARYLASEMREFTAFDLTSAAAVSAVLLFTGLAACVGPAWRAIRIDPALALRNE